MATEGPVSLFQEKMAACVDGREAEWRGPAGEGFVN